MRTILLITLTMCAACSCLSQRPGATIDVLHYDFDIHLSDSSNIIQGRAGIVFTTLKNTSTVIFDFIKAGSDKKGMNVSAVLDSTTVLGYTHDNNTLRINFPGGLTAGTQKRVTIVYQGIPADGLTITETRYGHRGFFADNWPNRARNWLPCIDHPADKATVDFMVTAPTHYQVVANGVQVEEINLNATEKLTHYREDVPVSPKVMVIGAGDFAVQYVGDVECIPIYSWVYPEDREKGFYDYAIAKEILPFYIKNIGPYAYRKLANVQSKTRFGGLENANTIFYSENSVTGTRKSEGLFAHEIAHQWFGNMATEVDWAHLWLSEGFATYFSMLYLKNRYGSDTSQKMLVADRRKVIAFSKQRAVPVVDSTETDYMNLLNANSYEKGSWILHMLQEQLGDSLFWRAIQTYYAKFAGRTASSEDFESVIASVTGRDWHDFFHQWLYVSGQPRLSVSSTYDAEKKMCTISITQQQQPLFNFPVELLIYGGADDGRILKSVRVQEREIHFTVPLTEAPQKIVIDPGVKLLFEEVK